MAVTEQITTADQLLHAPALGQCELVRGELVMMSPAGADHGWIAALITGALVNHVRQRSLGRVYTAEAGFRIHRTPDTVRAPDVAFLRAERIPPSPNPGFLEGAPDLAVEVVSPNDRLSEVSAKVFDWLDAGCREVWVVDPQNRTVVVHRGRGETTTLRAGDTLTGGEVLPGFSLPVAEIFEG